VGLDSHDPKIRVELTGIAGIAGDHRLVALAAIEDDAGVDRVVRAVLPAENTGRLGSWLVESGTLTLGRWRARASRASALIRARHDLAALDATAASSMLATVQKVFRAAQRSRLACKILPEA
jgi:hypothetical protein